MIHKIKLIGVYDYTVILTYAGLLFAIIGMEKATHDKFSFSVLCLLFAGICDAFDGIVARSKKNRTDNEKAFGIQLDSLCDVVSFGVYPAFLCYHMGVDGIIGVILVFTYCLCAVIRLAYFNVLEGDRQKKESGCAKFYRGLPVTSIAVILPVVYGCHLFVRESVYIFFLHVMLAIVAFLFVLGFPVAKPDWKKILIG